MNKQQIVGTLVAVVLAGTGVLAGCGNDDSTETTAQPKAAVSSTVDPAPQTAADLVLSPGAAGPVKVGMSKAQVSATGLFDQDVENPVDGCPVHALVWKKSFGSTFDVQALANGEIASIGVHEAGPKTASGLGIDSTLADVLAANQGARTVEAGYGQTGVRVHDTATDGWIGYLFDAALKDVKNTDKVTFIELTNGEKPGLMRDGC